MPQPAILAIDAVAAFRPRMVEDSVRLQRSPARYQSACIEGERVCAITSGGVREDQAGAACRYSPPIMPTIFHAPLASLP